MQSKQHRYDRVPNGLENRKMKNAFSKPGKIMEFEKKAKIMEKSWIFKISLWKNHGEKNRHCAHSIQY